MCEAKQYYILRELGTLEGILEVYRGVAGRGGQRVIDVIEERMDELLKMYDEEARELAVPT